LNRAVVAVTGTERVSGLVLDDGSQLACDLVVIATGLIPNTWLAYQCGLDVERGVAVDSQLRTLTDRRVFALGECAQARGKPYGTPAQTPGVEDHGAEAPHELIWQQAKVLAEQLVRGDGAVTSAPRGVALEAAP